MNLLTDYIWGDSELKSLTINYDTISLLIYNENLSKDIEIKCLMCFGITEIIICDDIMIDKISVSNAENHTIVSKLKKTFGTNMYDSDKTFDGSIYELNVSMISGFSFSIVCKSIVVNEV